MIGQRGHTDSGTIPIWWPSKPVPIRVEVWSLYFFDFTSPKSYITHKHNWSVTLTTQWPQTPSKILFYFILKTIFIKYEIWRRRRKQVRRSSLKHSKKACLPNRNKLRQRSFSLCIFFASLLLLQQLHLPGLY